MKQCIFSIFVLAIIFIFGITNTEAQQKTLSKSDRAALSAAFRKHMTRRGLTAASSTNATVQFGVTSCYGDGFCNPGTSLCSATAGATPGGAGSNRINANFTNFNGYADLTFDESQLSPDLTSYFKAYSPSTITTGIYPFLGSCAIDPTLVSQWGLSGPLTINTGAPCFVSYASSTVCEIDFLGLIPGYSGSISFGNPNSSCDASASGICSISPYSANCPDPVFVDTFTSGTGSSGKCVSMILNVYNLLSQQPAMSQYFQVSGGNLLTTTFTLAQDYTFSDPAVCASTGVPQGWTLNAGTYNVFSYTTINYPTDVPLFSGWMQIIFSDVNTGSSSVQNKTVKAAKGKKG